MLWNGVVKDTLWRLAWCTDGWVANLFCRDKFLTLFNSVPLTMWASQHIEQCAIRNSILTEGVKSFVTPQRERFMCAVKPFEVNCILLSFCACNTLCSSLYSIETEEDALALALSVAHILIQLCASLCTVSLCEHVYPFVFGHSLHVSWFGPLHFECICSGTVKNNQWTAEVCWLDGSCGGLRQSGCDCDPPPLHSPPEAVISVPVRAAAQGGGLEGFKDF